MKNYIIISGRVHNQRLVIRVSPWKWSRVVTLKRRRSRWASKSTISFFKLSMWVSMISIASWTLCLKKTQAISRKCTSRNPTSKSTRISSWTATIHYKILSAKTMSTKLCLMSFITHPNRLRKCSQAEQPRGNLAWSPHGYGKRPLDTLHSHQVPSIHKSPYKEAYCPKSLLVLVLLVKLSTDVLPTSCSYII